MWSLEGFHPWFTLAFQCSNAPNTCPWVYLPVNKLGWNIRLHLSQVISFPAVRSSSSAAQHFPASAIITIFYRLSWGGLLGLFGIHSCFHSLQFSVPQFMSEMGAQNFSNSSWVLIYSYSCKRELRFLISVNNLLLLLLFLCFLFLSPYIVCKPKYCDKLGAPCFMISIKENNSQKPCKTRKG